MPILPPRLGSSQPTRTHARTHTHTLSLSFTNSLVHSLAQIKRARRHMHQPQALPGVACHIHTGTNHVSKRRLHPTLPPPAAPASAPSLHHTQPSQRHVADIADAFFCAAQNSPPLGGAGWVRIAVLMRRSGLILLTREICCSLSFVLLPRAPLGRTRLIFGTTARRRTTAHTPARLALVPPSSTRALYHGRRVDGVALTLLRCDQRSKAPKAKLPTVGWVRASNV